MRQGHLGGFALHFGFVCFCRKAKTGKGVNYCRRELGFPATFFYRDKKTTSLPNTSYLAYFSPLAKPGGGRPRRLKPLDKIIPLANNFRPHEQGLILQNLKRTADKTKTARYIQLPCKYATKVSTTKRYWDIQLTEFLFASVNIGCIYTGLAFILKVVIIFHKAISHIATMHTVNAECAPTSASAANAMLELGLPRRNARVNCLLPFSMKGR